VTCEPSADRFHALWEHRAQRSVFSIPRTEWDRQSQNTTGQVLFDIRPTPLSGVASDASVIAVVAQQMSSAWGEVTIYRYDEKDAPTPVNVDRYAVMFDMQSHPQLPDMVSAASTEDNDNLRRYLGENAFLVRKNPGQDHWLSDVPATVRAIISRSNTSS